MTRKSVNLSTPLLILIPPNPQIPRYLDTYLPVGLPLSTLTLLFYQISIFARPVVGFFFGYWLVDDLFFGFLVLVLVRVLCCVVGDFGKRDCACR